MLQVFSTCRHFIRTLPSLIYDSADVEDVDTSGEDHIYDELRYVCMERPVPAIKRTKQSLILSADPLDLYRQSTDNYTVRARFK